MASSTVSLASENLRRTCTPQWMWISVSTLALSGVFFRANDRAVINEEGWMSANIQYAVSEDILTG